MNHSPPTVRRHPASMDVIATIVWKPSLQCTTIATDGNLWGIDSLALAQQELQTGWSQGSARWFQRQAKGDGRH